MTTPDKNQQRKAVDPKEDGEKTSQVEFTLASEVAPFPMEPLPLIREKAAKYIALGLVYGYMFLVCLCFINLFFFGGTVAETVELIKTVSAVLLGTIGAVLGYYFSKGT